MPTEASHTQSKDVTVKQDGFIVTGAGHVHGGAKELKITKPTLPGNPEVAESIPTWGNPDHPFYNVKPILHEPGPVGMSAFRAPDGPRTATSPGSRSPTTRRCGSTRVYDDLQPHTRVMGIYVVYVAPRPGKRPADRGVRGPAAPAPPSGPAPTSPAAPGPSPSRCR